VVQLIGFLLFLGPWTYYLFVIAATGEAKQAQAQLFNSVVVTYTYYEYTSLSVYSFWFMLFELVSEPRAEERRTHPLPLPRSSGSTTSSAPSARSR
jgi:hypothetical protein